MMLSLNLPLAAYQQGSLMLFNIRKDAASTGLGGRIVLAASVFKRQAVQAEVKATEKSEFEGTVSSLGSQSATLKLDGIKLLKDETLMPTEDSSFGESPPPASGFFFSY